MGAVINGTEGTTLHFNSPTGSVNRMVRQFTLDYTLFDSDAEVPVVCIETGPWKLLSVFYENGTDQAGDITVYEATSDVSESTGLHTIHSMAAAAAGRNHEKVATDAITSAAMSKPIPPYALITAETDGAATSGAWTIRATLARF